MGSTCSARAWCEPSPTTLRFASRSRAPPTSRVTRSTRRAKPSPASAKLSERGIEERDLQSSWVNVSLAFEGYGEARRSIGYRAAYAFQAFVRDLGQIESLLVELVEAGAFELDSVSYKSSRLRELRAEARRRSIAAARAKAELYAEALGIKVGKAIHVEDANPDELTRRSHTPDVDLSGHSDGDEPSEARGSIVVAAAVMVCFSVL